ncbi:MAG: putative toxin-antitoxin system toxin component, PIN family [Betaproteobacteria bacterium]
MPLRLVLDTNVWLDWLVFADPAVASVRRSVASGETVILIDRACMDELERALGYVLRDVVATPESRAEWLDLVRATTRRHDGPSALDAPALPQCRDPDDQKFLELARDCSADILVTRDKALLVLARHRVRPLSFRIVTPVQFPEAVGRAA